MSKTRYTPTDEGYYISGSSEIFNRPLYGSHKNDDKIDKFFTLAGDAPLFLGAITDWTKCYFGLYAKQGMLSSGLAITPNQRVEFCYSNDMDISSRWFHNSEDIASEFKNGWIDYELSQISPWFPDVDVKMEVYPLLPDDGFLVHYNITTDQRVIFTAGYGGITAPYARFEYRDEAKRLFSVKDCKDNSIKIGKNRAVVKHKDGYAMSIATSFDANFEIGSANALASPYPSTFLGSKPENDDDQVVKISSVIEQGKCLDGFIIVLRDTDEKVLEKWLKMDNPVSYIKEQIYQKSSCINFSTPEKALDLTIAPTVSALDASWHKDSFHHGAFAYHAPFLGWRNWYAPTVLGWHDRVSKTICAHLDQFVKEADGEERVWFDGISTYVDNVYLDEPPKNIPEKCHHIENTKGFMPYFLGDNQTHYNMQECAFDMILYYIEWTGDIKIAEKYYEEFCMMLDWEERIFDPDNDGLYQNFFNTWISDGHEYNGAGCAQSSSYNYRANVAMAKIAKKLGKPYDKFLARAEKIKKAVHDKLWLPNVGVVAESIDTIANKLVHPDPELSTIYLAIDCDIIDMFKSYTMLKFSETNIKSIVTPGNNGRLSYSADWVPKKYSTCGIFPSENAHLALTYYKLGLKEKGKKILDGIADCYFCGRNPGMAPHVQSSRCTSDLADMDFTDVSSTYLRLVTEGLFGVRINALDGYVLIAPNIPSEWEHASLSLKDISITYNKKGAQEVFDICCDNQNKKIIKLPMKSSKIDTILLNGQPTSYYTEPGIGNCFVCIETEIIGRIQVRIIHGAGCLPYIEFNKKTFEGQEVEFKIINGDIIKHFDISETLDNVDVVNNKIVYARTKNIPGNHTLFICVKKDEYECYIPADYQICTKEKEIIPVKIDKYQTLDISDYFNLKITDIHNQKYMTPRPTAYSIGVFPNGRYAHDWNHAGRSKVVIDDSQLRSANGVIYTKSGIPFATPEKNDNVACVSIWDNFPTKIEIPLSGKAKEVEVLFVVSTLCMQISVENLRISVEYKDGEEVAEKLVYPINVDDWLTPALQTKNETFYFSNYNHAIVQKIAVDETKELSSLKIEAVASEVIVGVLGVTLGK